MEYAFDIEYHCSNCGRTWKQAYPKRVRVNVKPWGGEVAVWDMEHRMLTSVLCPTCELGDAVTIKKRTPQL